MKTKQKIIESKEAEFLANIIVKIDGLTYKSGVNENSFHLKIQSMKLKLIGK